MTAGFAATTGLVAALGAAAFTFDAGTFEPVAFAAVLAVLLGIALLLFLEDLAAEALALAWARPLDALRLAAAAFFDFELLLLRVFCDTACARNCHAPVRCFFAETQETGQGG